MNVSYYNLSFKGHIPVSIRMPSVGVKTGISNIFFRYLAWNVATTKKWMPWRADVSAKNGPPKRVSDCIKIVIIMDRDSPGRRTLSVEYVWTLFESGRHVHFPVNRNRMKSYSTSIWWTDIYQMILLAPYSWWSNIRPVFVKKDCDIADYRGGCRWRSPTRKLVIV